MSHELPKIARKIIIMILICLTFNARENKHRGSLNFSIIHIIHVASQQEDHGKNVKYCGQGYLHAVTNQALVDSGFEESGCDDIAYFFLCLQK